MSRLQFWIFTVSSAIVALLFIGEIIVNHELQTDVHNLAVLERLIPEGREFYSTWQHVAARTYTLSQQDPALKQVLARQQITVTEKPAAAPAAPAPAPPAVPSGKTH